MGWQASKLASGGEVRDGELVTGGEAARVLLLGEGGVMATIFTSQGMFPQRVEGEGEWEMTRHRRVIDIPTSRTCCPLVCIAFTTEIRGKS